MSFDIKGKNITWVGKTDWEIRKFHGEEYATCRGTTYNSYLVHDTKTALIDTVWCRYGKEFVENLSRAMPLEIEPMGNHMNSSTIDGQVVGHEVGVGCVE